MRQQRGDRRSEPLHQTPSGLHELLDPHPNVKPIEDVLVAWMQEGRQLGRKYIHRGRTENRESGVSGATEQKTGLSGGH
jgi:hypothetical protein